jgi:hypothetical protein
MKTIITRISLAAMAGILALAIITPTYGQVDKVKEKAKDLKKELEGQSKTNKPAQKAPPAPPKPGK